MYKRQEWTPASTEKAAHANARFTSPISQCPVIDKAWNDPKGVPISAILFGGRRSSVIPLVYETFDWQHGTFTGASLSSETTAAATGEVGKLRHDPFAMLPFCGYNMGDYFSHWISMGRKADQTKLPRIFYVNWFRKNAKGEWLWPGFGDNSRVLKWIFERTSGANNAVKTAIGYVPREDALDTSNLQISREALHELLTVDNNSWKKELAELKSYYEMFGDKLPKEIVQELKNLEKRLDE